MKVQTLKTVQVLDLILVSLLGLFVWNGQAGEGFLLLSFVLFRLVVSFGLMERKKSNWLPVTLSTVWLLLTGSLASDFSKFLLEQPSFEMVKTGMLLLGDAGMDQVGSFSELRADESWTVELLFATLFNLLFWGWILFYPIISYVRQWRKGQFVSPTVWGGFKWSYGALLLTAGIWMILLLTSSKSEAAVIAYLYPFAVAWGWMVGSWKQFRLSAPAVKNYVVYAALFFGAFLIGRETEHFLSLFGLVTVLVLFYKKLSAQLALSVGKKDLLLLVVAGFLFWKSQFFEDLPRILMLGGGLLLVAIQSVRWYKASTSRSLSLLLFAVLGFVLPLLSIGYNPYAVTDARRLCKFDVYQYSHNGIVEIADGDSIGLRDRFTEILPCKYNQIALAASPHLPYLKVKEGEVWGLYNMETQKMVVDPDFASIYQYDKNFLKLQLEDGNTYYYPVGMDTRPESDSLLTYFVSVPCPEFMAENNLSYYSILQESAIDNAPVHSGIYHYLISTVTPLFERDAAPMDYWEWAEKSNRLVERLGNEHDLFMSDTASVAHQSVERINELVYQNTAGNQPELNGVSFVYAVLELYRTLDMNLAVVAEFKENQELLEAMKQEYACWMDYYWSSYRFYNDCIIGDQSYSALPMDLNGFLESNARQRYAILVDELTLFKTGELSADREKDITVERLEKYIHQMESGSAQPAHLQALRQAVLAWIKQRERVSSMLPSSYRDAYDLLTRNVKWAMDSELKWMVDEYKVDEEVRSIIAD